jgi:hypothetical protein
MLIWLSALTKVLEDFLKFTRFFARANNYNYKPYYNIFNDCPAKKKKGYLHERRLKLTPVIALFPLPNLPTPIGKLIIEK